MTNDSQTQCLKAIIINSHFSSAGQFTHAELESKLQVGGPALFHKSLLIHGLVGQIGTCFSHSEGRSQTEAPEGKHEFLLTSRLILVHCHFYPHSTGQSKSCGQAQPQQGREIHSVLGKKYTKGTSKEQVYRKGSRIRSNSAIHLGGYQAKRVCSSRPLVGGGLVEFIQPDAG